MRITRRNTLRLLSAAAMAGTLGRRLPVRAQTDIPKRLLVLHLQTGSMPGLWEPMAVAGAASPTEREWIMNPGVTARFAPFRDRMNFFENLDMVTAAADPLPPANAHQGGGTHSMNGAFRVAGDVAGGVSITRFISDELIANGTTAPFDLLEFGWRASHESHTTYSAPGERNPLMIFPNDTFTRLWPFGTGDEHAMDEEARARAREHRNRVFQLVRDRYALASGRLSGTERIKLEQHLSSVSDLARRIDQLEERRTLGQPPDAAVAAYRDAVAMSDGRAVEAQAPITAAAIEADTLMIAEALHSGLTNVVTFELGAAPEEAVGFVPGQHGAVDLHELVHRVMERGRPEATDPDAIATIRLETDIEMGWVARMVEELDARVVEDGSSLLDHTIFVFCSQIAHGGHSLQRLPWFTVGSGGGALNTGRYFRHGRDASDNGRSHTDFWLTIARAMGSRAESFGEPGYCRGVIDGMLT